jgi:hypothetical protein
MATSAADLAACRAEAGEIEAGEMRCEMVER